MSPAPRPDGTDRADQVGGVSPVLHDGDSAAARRDEIGWFRGIVTGLAILLVGLVVSVGSANEILTNVSGMSRDALAYLASAVFLVVVVVAAWVLRRLQSRGLI